MKNEQFEKDISVAQGLFNKLNVIEQDGEIFLKGEIDIIDSNGQLWDTYQVEVKGSDSYPLSFPKLFETGNAFPKIVDWHVYEFDDKSCCIDIPPSEKLICKDGLNVFDYIKQFAIPYLANQSFRVKEGFYLYGEYSHGVVGKIEFYQNKLKARNTKDLISMFDLIIDDYNPPRTALCPFCHKKKFRHCHRDVFRELHNIKNCLINDKITLIRFFLINPDYNLP